MSADNQNHTQMTNHARTSVNKAKQMRTRATERRGWPSVGGCTWTREPSRAYAQRQRQRQQQGMRRARGYKRMQGGRTCTGEVVRTSTRWVQGGGKEQARGEQGGGDERVRGGMNERGGGKEQARGERGGETNECREVQTRQGGSGAMRPLSLVSLPPSPTPLLSPFFSFFIIILDIFRYFYVSNTVFRPWVSNHTARITGRYAPIPGTGMVWENPTHGLPVLNLKSGLPTAHYRYTRGKTHRYGNLQVWVTGDHRSTWIWVYVLGAACTCHKYLSDCGIFIFYLITLPNHISHGVCS